MSFSPADISMCNKKIPFVHYTINCLSTYIKIGAEICMGELTAHIENVAGIYFHWEELPRRNSPHLKLHFDVLEGT